MSRQVSKIEERFQRKLENLRNYYAFKNLRLSTFQNHGQLNKRSKQLKIFDVSEKITIFTINVSKIEQNFQISSVFKLNEGITLSLKFALLF